MCSRNTKLSMVVTSLAAMLLFGSCNRLTERNRTVCEQGIYQFHYRLDTEQYQAIYAEVEEEFRRASTEESFVALLQTIHEKLGHVQDSQLRLIQMNWSAEYGESVRVLQETKFTKGKAAEQFFWR